MARRSKIRQLTLVKTCIACKQTLPLSDFYKSDDSIDGASSNCKACTIKKGRARGKKFDRSKPTVPGEVIAIDYLRSRGVYAAPGKSSEWKRVDVVAWGCVRLEVKYASSKNRRNNFVFHFSAKQVQPDWKADVILFICDTASGQRFFFFDANDPILFCNGKRRKNICYVMEATSRKHRAGRQSLTDEIMAEHEDRYDLIETARNRIIGELLQQNRVKEVA